MTSQLALDLSLLPPPRLDNFVTGANAEVVAALRDWIAGDRAEPVIYLWGAPGAGKTHLLQAAVDEIRRRGAGAAFVPSGISLAQLAPGKVDVVAIDDVKSIDVDGQAALFSLLRAAAEGERRLLIAGDNAPSGMRLRPDVRTRLGAALVLHVRALSDEEKVEVLREHARERGFELQQEGALYLLRRNRRDLSGLLALLDVVDRYALQEKRPVTLALLREVTRQDLFSDEVAGVVESRDPFGPINDQ